MGGGQMCRITCEDGGYGEDRKGIWRDVQVWIGLRIMELDPETVQGNPHGKPCSWVGFVSVAVRRKSRFRSVAMVDSPTTERMSLKDRKCVVTGGTRGIGFSIGKAFMEAGAEVALVATRPPTEEVAKSLTEFGKWHHIQGDLGDIKSTEEIGDKALEVLGKVDVLVNNA
uniref:Protochlorophyllide reductase n=1 Tax=Rhodosorus marinus TaxID=101924 RepID=A0A7S0BFB7_9RHOD|mmetsp:Transcript_14192/g.20626  ORF Transcript_14192/g.20626 Transcript_14192/m.20626 type:complete len:170 (+) Transcript_14192:134-643(+)